MLDASNQDRAQRSDGNHHRPERRKISRHTGANNPEPPCNAENDPALTPRMAKLTRCSAATQPRRIGNNHIARSRLSITAALMSDRVPGFSGLHRSEYAKTRLQAGQDAFAINYGTGGIGAEVYANRIGVGPMGDCVDCKFEEFFLSAWSVGDPAMLVDKPANSTCRHRCRQPCAALHHHRRFVRHAHLAEVRNSSNTVPLHNGTRLQKRPRRSFPTILRTSITATSTITSSSEFFTAAGCDARSSPARTSVAAVAEQRSGSYLDSQMISPGASYTLEMVYNGSGNRNKVVGDSIFHCHFYPHFAAGMWAMWRTHDVFESGTFVYPQGTVINAKM